MSSNLEQFKKNRQELIDLSKIAKRAVKEGMYDSVNEALISFYRDNENKEFNTFWEWKDKGYNIKKGSVSFKVWGSPQKGKRPEPKEGQEDEYDYWPICYLFSNAQVEPSKKLERAEA